MSKQLKYFDKPNKRTIHSRLTINTGGLIIYCFFLFTILLYNFAQNIESIVLVGSFISIIGFIDDRKNLSPQIKIISIIMPCLYLIFNDIVIYDLGEYNYIGKIYLGNFSIFFRYYH